MSSGEVLLLLMDSAFFREIALMRGCLTVDGCSATVEDRVLRLLDCCLGTLVSVSSMTKVLGIFQGMCSEAGLGHLSNKGGNGLISVLLSLRLASCPGRLAGAVMTS